MVYDLRNYTEETLWGPYLPDGNAGVDWEKIEAVMLVLGHNMETFTEQTHGIFKPLWTEAFSGATPDSYESISMPQVETPLTPPPFEDPYNIQGTWMRVSSQIR